VERLGQDFQIRQYTPQEVILQDVREQEQMIMGRVAVLVNWDEQGPVVLSVLKAVAHRYAVPLVVLCGRNRAEHVAALVVGGDDVLVHPVNPIMLQARLVAYQRRVGYPSEASAHSGDGLMPLEPPEITAPVLEAHDVCVVGPLVLDRTARHFYIYGHLEPLPVRTFDLMAFFMEHAGECQARDVLLSEVWGIDYETGTNILDVQIYRLRGVLKKHGVAAMIETVRGVGYRLRGIRGI
jgi:DNA-binding response OmpR family regulator